MNNKEAFECLNSHSCIRSATETFLSQFELPATDFPSVRRKFSTLKSERKDFNRRSDLSTWGEMLFHTCLYTNSKKKRVSEGAIIFEDEFSSETRKPLSELTLKGLRNRLNPIIQLIKTVASRERVDPIDIATYTLQLISNENHDTTVSNICKNLISRGTFGKNPKVSVSIEKSAFLIDLLEIGKRRYASLRNLCQSENVILHSYDKVSIYRNIIVLCVSISYQKIVHQTIIRILETNAAVPQFPISIKIVDGLDGSGSHQMYSQYHSNVNLSTQNYILFAFRVTSITDCNNNSIYSNDNPNATFGKTSCIDHTKRMS